MQALVVSCVMLPGGACLPDYFLARDSSAGEALLPWVVRLWLLVIGGCFSTATSRKILRKESALALTVPPRKVPTTIAIAAAAVLFTHTHTTKQVFNVNSVDLAARCAASLGASKVIYIAENDGSHLEDTITGLSVCLLCGGIHAPSALRLCDLQV